MLSDPIKVTQLVSGRRELEWRQGGVRVYPLLTIEMGPNVAISTQDISSTPYIVTAVVVVMEP